MKMRLRTISIVIFLILSSLLLSGCKTTLIVHSVDRALIIPLFKDYAGTHGYNITYANDKTGAYHLDLGTVYVSGSSSATKSESTIQYPSSGPNQPMTQYEQTTWNMSNNPAHYAQASAAVVISQSGSDVIINIDTNDSGGTSMDDLKDYLKTFGYSVDSK